jgi:DNA-binding NtrC family response regulator
MSMLRVLIADDDRRFCDLTANLLQSNGISAESANDLAQCRRQMAKHSPHVLLQDLCFPAVEDGFASLRQAREEFPDTVVLMISGEGHIPDAVQAIRLGAVDFLEKPFPPEQLLSKLKQVERKVALMDENRELTEKAIGMVGSSPIMRRVYAEIANAARFDTPVLISGETGVGKELAARAIHRLSRYSGKPLEAINCAALPPDLIEGELFGSEAGAYTDARSPRKGYFERADGGMLFLDEIAEIPYPVQAKLLRALSESVVQKVGGRPVNVRVRVVCATNRDLTAMLAAGQFRDDLYYRVNAFHLHIPALREHRKDIPDLAETFLADFCARYNLGFRTFSPAALVWLTEQDWPGNVRELKHRVEYAATRGVESTPFGEIAVSDLHLPATASSDDLDGDVQLSFREAVRSFEEHFLRDKLRQHDWNITRTATAIGMDKSNLIKKLHLLSIPSGKGV